MYFMPPTHHNHILLCKKTYFFINTHSLVTICYPEHQPGVFTIRLLPQFIITVIVYVVHSKTLLGGALNSTNQLQFFCSLLHLYFTLRFV